MNLFLHSESVGCRFLYSQGDPIFLRKDKNLKESLNLEDKIAVRIPNSVCTLKLLNKCNLLVGTSANVSGDSSFTDPQECMKNVKNYDIFEFT